MGVEIKEVEKLKRQYQQLKEEAQDKKEKLKQIRTKLENKLGSSKKADEMV